MPKEEISEELQKCLQGIVDQFESEEKAVRERQLRQWRQLKLYWDGIQRIWYDEVAHDWRIWDEVVDDLNLQDAAHYDKPVNVFRAYLESIIAALSITIPPISCVPDDADNPLDVTTAKAGNRIAELIKKHNDADLLWLHALYIYCTEGLVFCYSYPKDDEKYGTYEEKEYQDEYSEVYLCNICQQQVPDELFLDEVKDEFMPGEEDVILQDIVQNEPEPKLCPNCGTMLDPTLQKSKLTVTKLIGITTKPKTRVCMEAYGGLYVKVPNYAMKQADIPYLIFSYETHYSNALARYPSLKDKFPGKISAGEYTDSYERWARLSPQYRGEYPTDTVTIRNCWLRPTAYHSLTGANSEAEIEDLKKKYPNGCKVIFVNDCFAEAYNEALDDCWTLTRNPLTDYIHHDPLGLLLVSVQDITNELISLTLQTIEHGIPQTFADPGVLNFAQYSATEVTAGGVFPAIPKSGKSVADAFYEVKTATLSGEVLPFAQKTQEMGQLVSGALPSLFGGGASQGSKTAAEYSMSRAQAQQRLQTTWKMLTVWWKEIFGKAIHIYIKEMVEDEKFVKRDNTGNYINVYIRKAELAGKIGDIELEANDQLPVTWAQKKDVIMQLMSANNPIIMEALSAPENIEFLKEAIGLTEFKLPGEDDRQKQYEEIQVLLNTEPLVMPPPPEMQLAVAAGLAPPEAAQPTELPSVEVDPDLDNHALEAEICRRWAKSDAGRLAKMESPAGYKNVILHMKMHLEIQMQQMMQQMMQQAQMAPPDSAAPGGKPENQSLAAPPKGNKNVTESRPTPESSTAVN